MNISYRYGLRSALTLTLISAVSAWAGAQEAGTNVPTPPPPAPAPGGLVEPGITTGTSAASGTSLGTSSEPTIDAETTSRTLPNRPLLITGAVVLGASYGASAIVAAVSDRDSNNALYYPVAGPWLALHERDCDAEPCSKDTLHRALLIGDGVLQGLGALGMLLSVMIPETTTRSWYLIGNENVVVVPQVGTAVTGLTAVGNF